MLVLLFAHKLLARGGFELESSHSSLFQAHPPDRRRAFQF
jgi:hypothetical protein